MKAKLQARWSGRRRAVVDGRAKSGEGASGGRWRVRCWCCRARGGRRSRKCDAGRALRELKPWPAVPGLPRRVDAESGHRRRVAPRGGQSLTRSGARRGAGRRAEAGQARRGAGLGRARRGARGGFAGPASAGGPEARRRPAKEKNPFSKYNFKEFLNVIFQILF